MNRNSKKGFTIVELIIVIAVIAVLAAVLIPTFSNLIQKANEAKDTALVSNLNKAVAMDTSKNETVYDVLTTVRENAGYDVGKINAAATNNEILWDSANNCFVYSVNGEIKYIPDTKTKDVAGNYDYWKISSKQEDIRAGKYSIYWTGANISEISVTTGFDAGEVEVKKVIYNHSGNAQKIAIRTNSESAILEIDAANDTVKHFGEVGIVNIIRTANASYHEFGLANYIQNASGRVVSENGGEIKIVILTEKNSEGDLPAVVQNNGGLINSVYATTNIVADNNNTQANAVILEKWTDSNHSGNVLVEDNAGEEDIINAINEKKDETASKAFSEEIKENAQDGIVYVARIGAKGYTNLNEALAANTENTKVVLLGDYDLPQNFETVETFIGIFDGHGYTIDTSKALNAIEIIGKPTGKSEFRNITLKETARLVKLTGAEKYNYTSVVYDNIDYISTDNTYYELGHNDSLYTSYNYDYATGRWGGNITIENCDVSLNLKGADSSNSSVFLGAYMYAVGNTQVSISNCSYTGTFIGNFVSLVLSNGQETSFAYNEQALVVTNLKNNGTLIGTGGAYAIGAENHDKSTDDKRWIEYYDLVQTTTGGTYTKMDSSKLSVSVDSDKNVSFVDAGTGAVTYKILLYAGRKIYNSEGVEYASNYNFGIEFVVTKDGATDIKQYKFVDYDTAIKSNLITSSDCSNTWLDTNSEIAKGSTYQVVEKDGNAYYVFKFATNENGDTYKVDLQLPTVQVAAYDQNGLIRSVNKVR